MSIIVTGFNKICHTLIDKICPECSSSGHSHRQSGTAIFTEEDHNLSCSSKDKIYSACQATVWWRTFLIKCVCSICSWIIPSIKLTASLLHWWHGPGSYCTNRWQQWSMGSCFLASWLPPQHPTGPNIPSPPSHTGKHRKSGLHLWLFSCFVIFF